MTKRAPEIGKNFCKKKHHAGLPATDKFSLHHILAGMACIPFLLLKLTKGKENRTPDKSCPW
jgi:hypothetical protein